ASGSLAAAGIAGVASRRDGADSLLARDTIADGVAGAAANTTARRRGGDGVGGVDGEGVVAMMNALVVKIGVILAALFSLGLASGFVLARPPAPAAAPPVTFGLGENRAD